MLCVKDRSYLFIYIDASILSGQTRSHRRTAFVIHRSDKCAAIGRLQQGQNPCHRSGPNKDSKDQDGKVNGQGVACFTPAPSKDDESCKNRLRPRRRASAKKPASRRSRTITKPEAMVARRRRTEVPLCFPPLRKRTTANARAATLQHAAVDTRVLAEVCGRLHSSCILSTTSNSIRFKSKSQWAQLQTQPPSVLNVI